MIKQPPSIIAIEGIDGSGKGTQSALLAERLNALGHKTTVISFPDYTLPYGKLIGDYLKGAFGDIKTAPVIPLSLLYSMNRAERRSDIQNASRDNQTLILDRYTGSNLAHQGARLPPDELDGYVELMEQAEYGMLFLPRPDITIFLDVDEGLAEANVGNKAPRAYTDATHDLHESDRDYMGKVRATYRLLSDRYGWRRVSCGDATKMRTAGDIHHEVFSRMYF